MPWQVPARPANGPARPRDEPLIRGAGHARAGSVSAAIECARPQDVAAAQGALAGVAEGALEVHCQLAAVVEVAEADGVPELVRADALVVIGAVGALVGPLHVGGEAGV